MRLVNGKRVFTKPNTIAHYAHDEYTDRDYLFIHVREPHNFGEDYTESIVELLKFCNVTNIVVSEVCMTPFHILGRY